MAISRKGTILNTSIPPLRRAVAMPVKYWARAGIMLSYWCNASCENCYLCCGPEQKHWISADDALQIWRELEHASPHGCKIHLSGGEPFGNWPLLIEIARRARDEGLGMLESVETNAFWATEPGIVHDRIRQLDSAGMMKLSISCDPYHQQFVPIERVKLLVEIAEKILSPQRVQVRWMDFYNLNINTSDMSISQRREFFIDWLENGRDRIAGRAAAVLADELEKSSIENFVNQPCSEVLLRGQHVHIDPFGNIIPGVCAGLCLGNAMEKSVGEVWLDLYHNHKKRPILNALAFGGAIGLLELAKKEGYKLDPTGYAGKCHLCWSLKCFLRKTGKFNDELKPDIVYGES